MKLLVLGATGATGLQIVTQALERAHEVTAFVRDPDKLAISDRRLRVVTGNILDNARAVAEAVRGQDAVISALGVGNSRKSFNIISRSMRAIVPAMESHGVRRLIFVSAFGVGETRRDVPLVPRIVQRLLLADVFADKKASEDDLRRSGLDWTLVYPVILTNGPRTAKYLVGERLDLHGLPKISRADVADFVLSQLEDATYLRKGVLISD
ncbi:MAG: SDR family oxidoreductase [Betaproteobacteria bacterium]|nr:SDR family oxidoreductase [Betaproteobacteria bacterium]